MSLLVWLPLIRDNTNQGLLKLTPSNLGTVSYVSGGKIGNCLSAGDGTQIINGISYNSNLVSELGDEYSACVWVKPSGTHVHYNGTIISSGDWNKNCWSFGLSQDNSQVDVFCSKYNTYITCAVPVNEWTHLACSCKAGVVKLYKNGVYVGQRAIGATLDSDATNFTVGRETYASGYFSFNGNINDVRIYNHALSAKEIELIAQGLVARYTLDNYDELTAESSVIDSSGYNYHGVTNTAQTGNPASARYSASTNFNGSDNAIKIPFNNMLGMTAASKQTYTFSCWIYVTTLSSKAWATIFGGPSGFEIETRNSSSTTPSYYAYSWGKGSVTYTLDAWHHLAMVHTSSDSKWYLDGELAFTGTSANVPVGNYFIGSWSTVTGQNYKGLVSDFRIYTTALTADAIKELYQVGASISNDGRLFTYELKEETE